MKEIVVLSSTGKPSRNSTKYLDVIYMSLQRIYKSIIVADTVYLYSIGAYQFMGLVV
jgi:hypothetical protein